MSKLQIIPTFLTNKGIVLDKPEEFLKNQFSTGDSRNMEFADELLQGRLGLGKFDALGTGSAVELSGPILLIDQFWKYTGTCYLLFATTKDIYKYNFPGTGSSAYYDILTPIYNTGTITVGTGSEALTIYGGGGASFGDNITEGDYLKIGTGTPMSTDTWYEVDSVGAGTGAASELTMVSIGTGISGATYSIRQCFSGSSTDFWQSRPFLDDNLGEVWIATNGVDTPVYWTGSNQVVALTGLATGFTTCKYLEVYADRLVALWCVEGGNQPQRIRWSAVANCLDWTDADFHDFIEDGYWITGSGIMANSHIVFRERDAYIGRYVGGDYTFDYEKSNSCAGVWAAPSLIVIEREAYYYGPDNKFHKWDMISDQVISENIFSRLKNYNPNLEQYIFGWQVDAKNQIRWFAPYSDTSYNNECIVYDYVQDILQIWAYGQAQACCSIGEYLQIDDLYMDDIIWGDYYVDEQDGYWDTRLSLSGAPVIIYGGYDGYVRKADTGYTDDETTYNRVFESIRNNHKLPHINKRLWKQQHWLNSELSGSVTLQIKKDDNNSFESDTKTISLINANRDIIKEQVTWNKQAENFKIQIAATNHFAMLGWLDYFYQKGKTVR